MVYQNWGVEVSDEIPSPQRIRDELRRVGCDDDPQVVNLVAALVRESYALGVSDGIALGREQERAQIPLPLPGDSS